jgi:hypothetical protein
LIGDQVRTISITEYVLGEGKKINEVTGSDGDLTYEPLPEDNPLVRQPDVSKAQEVLGWTPDVDGRRGWSAR